MNDLAWTWIGIRATGITAWVLLTVVVLYGLTLRTRLLGQAATPKTLLVVHRWLAATALTFVAVHMALLLIDPYVTFTVPQLFIPMIADWQPAAVTFGIAAFWCLIPVLIIARLRPRLGKRGNVWFKRSHVVAYAAWPLATLHYILAGTDALTWASLLLLLAGTGAVVFMLLTRGYVPKPVRKRAAATRPVREPSQTT